MEDKPIKVLLIEDNPEDARLLQEEFSETMETLFEITAASTLEEGITALKNDSPDIILLDLSLPGKSGIDAFTNIQNITKDIPIVVVSGTKDENLALQAVKNGAQDYLAKDEINSNLLIKTIKHSIERHKIYKELEEYKAELKKYKNI